MMHTDVAGIQHASWYTTSSSGTEIHAGSVTAGECTVFWPKVPKAPTRHPLALTVDATGPNVAAGAPAELTGTVTGTPFKSATVTISVDALTAGEWLDTTYELTLANGDSVTAYGYTLATAGTSECPGGYLVESTETGWDVGTGKWEGSTGSFVMAGCLTYVGGGVLALQADLVGSYIK